MASRQPPFFYHILMNPSSPHLPLPAKFVKKYLRNKILKDPILKSANGGYSWKLKMKKFDDDHSFCFVGGWSKVVKDVGLLFGEFLLFRYVGYSVFSMHVYSVNGCEKILVPKVKVPRINKVDVSVEDEVVFDDDDVEDDDEVEDEDDDVEYGVRDDVEEEDEDVEDEEDDDVDEDDDDVEFGDDGDEDDGEDEDVDVDVDGNDGDPFFIMTSSKRNKYKLRFPPDLVALAKINTKETITLKNDDGYEKEMPVRSDKQNKSKHYYVAEGWKEFQRSNDISEGDECVFKFITSEDKLCLAKVTKKKTRATGVDNDDMDDDDGVNEEGEAEAAKDDDFIVDGDDIFDDDGMDEEGEGEDVKLVDNDDKDDSVDGDEGDPSFIMTSSNTYQYKLPFPADFVALAGINTKETITLKNLDGYEKEFPVRLNKQYSRTCYYLGAGWKEFQRNTNISKGDKFVVKFITSEDKFCLAKVTKKRTRATEVDNNDVDDDDGMDEEGEAEAAKDDDDFIVDGDDIFDDDGMDDVDEEGEDEDVKLVDNDDEDDYVDGDDGDPSFVLTSSNTNRYKLWFSTDFVALAGINRKETITLKNLDGYEKELPVQSHKHHTKKHLTYYYLTVGWKEFQRNTNISEGDKFVFKFITSEDKFCVAKITKKKTLARPPPPAAEAPVTEVDDGIDDKDVDEDVELFDEGNPSFVATITPTYNRVLRMPSGFGQLAGFNTKKTLTLKGLDGYEKEMPLRVDQKRYYVGMGWKDILQSTSISEGDKCVFKFIASEDKLCLAKIIKKETQARPQLPAAEAQETEFNDDDTEDDEDVEDDNDKDENEDVERVDDGIDDDDDDNDKDENEDVEPVDDVDPFFVVNITTTHKYMLRLPPEFVELAGIDGKKNIIIKCLDGYERQMVLRPVKQGHLTRYCLSMGWLPFKRSNNILEGDVYVFKYIRSEDKMCLEKITKKETRASPPPPAAETLATEVDDDDLKVDGIDDKDAEVNDNKVDDENVKLVDDAMDDKDVNGDDNKDEDENVELVDDGMDVDAEDNKDEDKDAEFADGNPFFVVTITPNHKWQLRLPIDFVALAGIESKENIIMKSLDGNEIQMSIRTDKRRRSTQYHLSVGWPAFKRSNNISEGDECIFKYITSEDKMCLAKIIKTSATEVDADPCFVVTITPCHKSLLRLPTDFVALAGIESKENIIMKSLDENETRMSIRTDKRFRLTQYHLSVGWPAFKQSNNISEGDECVFKYITSEDKMCLAKLTKEKTSARPPPLAVGTAPTEVDDNDLNVDDGMDGKDVVVDDNKDEDENVELVDDGMDDKDVNGDDDKDKDENVELVDDRMDDKDVVVDDNKDEDENVELVDDGMDGKDGVVDNNKDEDVNVELVDDGLDDKDVNGDDNKDEDENVELVDDGMDDKDVNGDDDKDKDENVELVDDRMDDKDVVVDDNKDEDENVELVDDGMDGKDVVVDNNKDKDVNVELVDDGMDDKDVNGDDNKDEDENVELVDDGMDDKDVVVDDNKDEDENVELVDDGMDGKDVVVDDNKDEDENVELVDDGMDGKDVVVDDNKDEDVNVELVDDGMDDKDVNGDDNKDEDENVELVDDGMDDKDVNGDDDKDKDENVELVDDRMYDKDVVVDDNKDEDENVELVDDGMDGKDVVVDDNKDEDVNVELVDDGMDDKDVNGDDNKDEDENVELVDDRMDDKDVVVDDNKDEDENVELVDDGMDGKDVVVDDNKDEDENVELVDGMDGKDVVVDDNKDEDVNVELVGDGMDDKDVNGDDNKDEDENVELVDDGMDVDANDNKDEDNDVELVDGNPFFVVTITPSHKPKLRLPPDFVLAGIDGKKNIIMKCPDGSERQMVLRSVKQGHLTRYYLSMGWSAFRRSNNISEGDECVFKYITSEDKMCLAKITKKETRSRPPPPATETPPTGVDDSMDDEYAEVDDNKDKDENVELVDDGMDDNDVDEYVKLVDGMDDKDMEFDNKNEGDENENVELVDDGMDDKDVDEYVKLVDGTDNKDGDDNVELVDDRDPFFRVTITPNHKSILRLPPDFVGLAGINTKKNIIVKSLDGNESQMAVRSDKRFNSLQYHLAQGWVAFTQRNNLSQGDECVFKYITSEDKMCLAKVIKTSATEVDADPYFVVTITPCHKSMLWLPTDFVGLAGIDTKENIIVKSLDGNETQMALRLCPGKKNQLIRYRLTMGWPAFKRSNNISEGDECVFKYITSEDKMCLAKVTKEKTQTRLPSPAEVVKRKRGWLPPVTAIKMTAAETVKMRSRRPPPVEITVAEAVKRKRGQPPPSSPRVTKDMKRKKGPRPRVHSADVEGVDEGVEVTKKPRGRPAK